MFPCHVDENNPNVLIVSGKVWCVLSVFRELYYNAKVRDIILFQKLYFTDGMHAYCFSRVVILMMILAGILEDTCSQKFFENAKISQRVSIQNWWLKIVESNLSYTVYREPKLLTTKD